MASWGNQQNTPYAQDMESPTGYHLQATKNASNDAAIKGTNSGGNAIQSDGKLQVNGDSDLNGDLDVSGTIHTDAILGSSGNTVQVGHAVHGSVIIGDGQYSDSYTKVYSPLQCTQFIDTIFSNPLSLGQTNASSVQLGHDDINTHVLGPLSVDDNVSVAGTLDLDANGTGAAMDVNNSNAGSAATAIKATGSIALDARGHVAIESDKGLSLDGLTHQSYIIFNSANSRLEFYIGGTLRFIIDSTGGHNP
jgi:hypothetical protein